MLLRQHCRPHCCHYGRRFFPPIIRPDVTDESRSTRKTRLLQSRRRPAGSLGALAPAEPTRPGRIEIYGHRDQCAKTESERIRKRRETRVSKPRALGRERNGWRALGVGTFDAWRRTRRHARETRTRLVRRKRRLKDSVIAHPRRPVKKCQRDPEDCVEVTSEARFDRPHSALGV